MCDQYDQKTKRNKTLEELNHSKRLGMKEERKTYELRINMVSERRARMCEQRKMEESGQIYYLI